jgi:hypothetical protein
VDAPGRNINELSLNRKLRELSDCGEKASPIQTIKGGGDFFFVQRLPEQKFSTTSKNHEPMLQLKRSIVTVQLNLCANAQCDRRW